MKLLPYAFVCLFLCIIGCSNPSEKAMGERLESGFVTPPDSILTSIYWYWISDNISEEGVVKDLHSMKEAGINRAFIGNIGLNENEGKVKFYSDEWWKITHTALKTATELGIEIGIFNSPGWSQSGGPWVKPNQAMRYLASSTVTVDGGKSIDMDLPKPEGDFEDVKLIAFPAVETQEAILTTSTGTYSPDKKTLTFNIKQEEPFTVRSITLYSNQKPINCKATFEVNENNRYRTISEFKVDRYNSALNVGFDPYSPIVISIPKTISNEFRLNIESIPFADAIRSVTLSPVPAVERYPEKTLAKMFQSPLPYWHEYQWPVQPEVDDASLIVNAAEVKDISQHLTGDRLKWEAPEGNWTIIRTGMLPTGTTNSPASPEATGLETDKMSRKHIEAHFDAFLGEMIRKIPAEDRKCWKVVVQDSYETGGQNFTDSFMEDFSARYGYDPLPFLPVYSGIVVESQDASDRFLWDVRRLVADKVSYDYVGGLRDVCHKYGLKTWLENYGHWGFPGEFLQYGGQSDEIGGEFWSSGDLGNIENRAASSCGHIYGKTRISAESFTQGGQPFMRHPAMMKQRGDRFFAEGINNTLLHVYISQPYEDKNPGVNAWFGNEFNRKNTWYPHLDLFTAYLKRVNFMLQQGLNIADVAYFIGEDAPKMTGIADPKLPVGYQFDYINAEVIERDMFVKDGMLTLPHGTQYRILVLPKLETMRPELLRKIKKLIDGGGVVMGPAPKRSPSYKDYPEADREVEETAASLWGKTESSGYAKIGKGMLIADGMTMQQALDLTACVPDCALRENDPVHYGHRKAGNLDIYFITNQSEKQVSVSPEFRVRQMQPELWDAIQGTTRELPAYSQTETGTIVPLLLEPNESVFIVFRKKASLPGKSDRDANYPDPLNVLEINTPWHIAFEQERRGPETSFMLNKLLDITTLESFDVKHYSGKLTYTTIVELAKKPAGDLFLNLNDVVAMAKVYINDEYAGGVWTPPYRLNIGNLMKEGGNDIRIEVTTTWMNRLIGDSQLPESDRLTWLFASGWTKDSPLQKSGLIGPVVIEEIDFSSSRAKTK